MKIVPLKCWPFKSNQLKSQCKRGRGLTKRLHLNCVEMSAALQAECALKKLYCVYKVPTTVFILQYILHVEWLFTDVDMVLVALYLTKIKCSKHPEPLVKWCVWVNVVQQGRVVHNGEQIRTSDLGASVRPRSLSTDRWGILNNRGQMRSHDCSAWAAHAPQVRAHPRRRERRSKPGSGTRGVWESDKIFWGCAGERICFCSIPDCLTVKKVKPIWSVVF